MRPNLWDDPALGDKRGCDYDDPVRTGVEGHRVANRLKEENTSVIWIEESYGCQWATSWNISFPDPKDPLLSVYSMTEEPRSVSLVDWEFDHLLRDQKDDEQQ